MSTDFQIAWSCKHNIVREPVSFADDRLLLLTSTPIMAAPVMHVNDIEVPSSGLYSSAKVVGTKGGPFVFEQVTELYVETVATEFMFTLKPGSWNIQQIIERLYRFNSTLVFKNHQGKLLIEDTETGHASRLYVRGDATSVLGLDFQPHAKGRKLIPSWGIFMQEGHVHSHRPMFMETPKLFYNAKIEMSYIVDPNKCRRCMATRVENDLMFDDRGEPVLIRDEDLLYQFVLKALLTDRGSNPFHRWYGTQLRELVGRKAIAAAAAALRAEVKRTVNGMRSLQQKQAKFQKVSLKETLYQIDYLNVQSYRDDPTSFLIELTVRNASNKPIALNIVYTVPGAASFVSENGIVVRSLGTY